jgi:hypothetical protein
MEPKTLDAAKLDIRVHNGEVAWAHIESEYRDNVDEIISTLVPDGPLAYTVGPNLLGDGSIPKQIFETDIAGIRRAYEAMHGVSAVTGMQATTEIRGEWYSFAFGLGAGYDKATGASGHVPNAVLFPTMGKNGITGELIWKKTGLGAPYTGGNEGDMAAETAILAQHEAYLECLRNADVDGVAKLHHSNAQIGIRDHVNDTGTIASIDGRDEYRAHLEKFFERFDVLDIKVINRFTNDWLVFAELLWVVTEKAWPRSSLKFYTADHAEVHPSGLFASRIGHGTDREVI